MENNNPFFTNRGPFKISDILKKISLDINIKDPDYVLEDIKDLTNANENDVTFLNSNKYKEIALNTKAAFCVTTDKLQNLLPMKCNKILVENVLLTLSKITMLFYPDALEDHFDKSVINIDKLKLKNNIQHGLNLLVGKNVSFGANCSIGHNTLIESNVVIGDNCSIGSNVIIRKTIIGNNVKILDGCVIGKKGFGFFPNKETNLRYPHIGIVIIKDNAEIGCGSTIDRGSISNTIIGKNTFLDNQVHIAHNVKIGANCMIAGQVGFAGSAIIGNNVMIGGQAGISGHLKIGDNVQIGGGSGVVKNIPDNTKVMGYPAKDLKSFIKEN